MTETETLTASAHLLQVAEQVLAQPDPADAFREAVASATIRSSEAALALVHDMARQEVTQRVWRAVRVYLVAGATVEQVQQELLQELLRGADDKWSGRGNDLRRVAHDGTRAAIERVFQLIELHS